MGICEETRTPLRVRRHLFKIFIAIAVGVIVLVGLGVVFHDTPPLRHLQKRFMMGSMTSHTNHHPSKQYHFSHAAVATDNAECSKVGRDALIKGGSAVDAAISAMLCLGVINLHSTGIGGGGFMMVYDHFRKKGEMIDFRETAPLLSNRDLFQGDAIKGIKGNQSSGLAVGVPGELCGMEAAWKKYGRLQWKELFAPAIALARNGFPLPETVNIAIQLWKKVLMKDHGFRRIFMRHGKLLKTGDIIKRPRLAKVLSLISRAGNTSPFYHGYHFKSSDLTKHPVRTYHRIIESFKFAFKYRSMLGDPDYEKTVDPVVKEMMDERIATKIRHMIWDNQTHAQGYYGNRYHVPIKTGTTHLSVLGPHGDAVSVTSTVNGYFGAKFLSTRLGIVYNNEMDDFSAPGITNEFGLLPAPVNFIKPGKRPQSSAVPAIILDKDGHVSMVIGGAGGTIITTAVANVSWVCLVEGYRVCLVERYKVCQVEGYRVNLVEEYRVIMNYFWFKKNLMHSVSMPRLHDQLYPEYVFAETWFPPTVINGLHALGHKVNVSDTSHGVVQAIVKNPARFTSSDRHGSRKGYVHRIMSKVFAESDYRKGGIPAGY
ncbi:hypothetical protein QZH41_010649 [Actinostola sp. cb2023]|nr:hypothetical protein QZH41_010649 [Actinostola sp. cb2023]